MDSDRRSGFSQYNENAYSANSRAAPNTHARDMSMGSNFYNPRASRDLQAGQRGTYFDNRETLNASKGDDLNPDNGWDVYADFNNAGPKYSSIKAKSDGSVR